MEAEKRRQQFEHALESSETQVSAVLRADPYPAGRRSLAAVRVELADRHAEQFEVLRRAARSTRDQADAAASRLGFLDHAISVLGFRTEAMREAENLEQAAVDAQRAFEVAGCAYKSELGAEHARAPAIARERRRKHDEWKQTPDVQQAIRERHANGLIREVARSGDSWIGRLAQKDLQQAQSDVLRREADRQAEEQRLREVVVGFPSVLPQSLVAMNLGVGTSLPPTGR